MNPVCSLTSLFKLLRRERQKETRERGGRTTWTQVRDGCGDAEAASDPDPYGRQPVPTHALRPNSSTLHFMNVARTLALKLDRDQYYNTIVH